MLEKSFGTVLKARLRISIEVSSSRRASCAWRIQAASNEKASLVVGATTVTSKLAFKQGNYRIKNVADNASAKVLSLAKSL